VKLSNLTAAQVSERVSGSSAIIASGFGAAETNRSERANVPVISSSGFGDARVAKPGVAQASVQPAAATTPVEILFKPRPEYTEEARKLRLEGEVVLEMRFGASGQAEVLRVTRGLGHGLDESAERAALSIKFRPALKAGMPVDSTAVVHILFQLAY
jgi:TonB family protein